MAGFSSDRVSFFTSGPWIVRVVRSKRSYAANRESGLPMPMIATPLNRCEKRWSETDRVLRDRDYVLNSHPLVWQEVGADSHPAPAGTVPLDFRAWIKDHGLQGARQSPAVARSQAEPGNEMWRSLGTSV